MRHILLFLILLFNCVVVAQRPFSMEITTCKNFENESFLITILDKDQRKILRQDNVVVKDGLLKYEGYIPDEVAFVSILLKKDNNKLSKIVIVNSGTNHLQILNSALPTTVWAELKIVGSNGIVVLDSLNRMKGEYYDKFGISEGNAKVLSRDGMIELNKKQMNYLINYPNDNFSTLLLYELSLYNFSHHYQSYVRNTYNNFSESVKASDIGKVLRDNITNYFLVNKNMLTDKKVPAFSIEKYDGSLFKNEELNGDAYLIVFSATWCAPCQQELPILKNIYKKYNSKGLKVIYFNEDDDIGKWALHIKDNNLASWINVSERRKARDGIISKKFGVYSVPAYFLIDKNSNIVYNSTIDQEGRLNKLAKAIDNIYNK